MSGNDIGGHPGTTPLAISGVRVVEGAFAVLKWIGIALWVSAGVLYVLGGHWPDAGAWFVGAFLLWSNGKLGAQNDRLRATCGEGREPDRIEVQDGVTVRYWYVSRK